MCIIPYGTQMGEISFCAYNTGVGWRNIVEKMLMNATVADWYRQHGRHKVYAGGKSVPLPEFDNPLTTRIPQLEPRRSRGLRIVASSDDQQPAAPANVRSCGG